MRFLPGIGLGAVLTMALLEAMLRLMPVNSGVSMEDSSPAKPFAHYLAAQSYMVSDGWALENARRGTINDQGFANSRDYRGTGGTLVIGDSYIQSFMLDYGDTVQGRLDTMLSGNVHAAAASGNGLADSLRIAQFYLPRLRPRTVVFFVEPFDLSGLLDAPVRGHNGFSVSEGTPAVVHNAYRESPLKRLIQKSALLRYAYYNLKIADWLSRAASSGPAARDSMGAASVVAKEQVLRYYFSQIQGVASTEPSRVLFLMDGDRRAIHASKPPRPAPAWNDEERRLFLRLASMHGFEVIDMQPVFVRHWVRYKERMDFLPADGHWNRVAHKLAAEEVFKRLQAGEAARQASP